MHKTYVTFGSDHEHKINDKILNKDTVAIIETNSPEDGREKAFEYFGKLFCFEYPEEYWDDNKMKYFPGGYVSVNIT